MCLLTYQKEPIILKEDKVVWKLMRQTEEGVCSVFRKFIWNLGTLYKEEINIGNDTECFDYLQEDMYRKNPRTLKKGVISIDKGFHAFYDKDYAYRSLNCYYDIYECIIPAGSEYYQDETGLCVSNQIIILEKID